MVVNVFTNLPQNRHDVAEIAGLMAMSFGTEDIDRYTMIYKKDFAPSEDEIEARRNGDDWNAEKAKEYAEKVCRTSFNPNQIVIMLLI